MLILPLEILYALHLLGWFPAAGLLAVVGMFWVMAVLSMGWRLLMRAIKIELLTKCAG